LAISSTVRQVLLSEKEAQSLLDSAHDCAEGECSIDDVSQFIHELKGQQVEMNKRLEEIMNLVSNLQKLNEKKARNKDEIRAYVQDLLRVFNPQTGGWATGFSGDIGDGPKTAYDVLEPKKWKP
jgi:polyhydroxyalkanoate synthesis regulator phasin